MRLPGHHGTELRLVVVKWPRGERPMMLLTTFRALAAVVTAVFSFAMAWLRLGEKLGMLADHVKRISRRMFEVPDFFFYAITDGPISPARF